MGLPVTPDTHSSVAYIFFFIHYLVHKDSHLLYVAIAGISLPNSGTLKCTLVTHGHGQWPENKVSVPVGPMIPGFETRLRDHTGILKGDANITLYFGFNICTSMLLADIWQCFKCKFQMTAENGIFIF